MRTYWWYLLGLVLIAALATGALAADVLAHPDGCHRWHSCPSDDGGYVCGDLGHCAECPSNSFCLNGRSRSAVSSPTNTPRPTRTPEPTHTPRPTRTPEPTRTPRAARDSEPSAARPANVTAESTRLSGESPRAVGGRDGDATQIGDNSEDGRGSAAFFGTGAPLAAAPTRSAAVEAPSRPAVVVAEYAGVRVAGPLQWTIEGEQVALTGAVVNGGAQPRSMVLTLYLLDGRGERLGTTELVVWDLLPGESRPFSQPIPLLPVSPTDVSARLEPVGP